MLASRITDDDIIDVLNKHCSGQNLNDEERKSLDRWVSRSAYNRFLLEDISTDGKLKSIISSHSGNRSLFWKVVITYRTALHPGMPRRKGNFWQRMLRPFSRPIAFIFRRKRK
jgi:hypothetical protein